MPEELPETVINYLKTLQEQGIETMPVDEEARLILRNWMIGARKNASDGKPSPPSPTPAPNPKAEVSYRVEEEPPSPVLNEEREEEKAPEDDAVEIKLQGNTLEEKLANLRHLAEHWHPARSLGTLRDTMVFAVGNPHSKLMLVGEAPGYHEELEKEPFVGKAGAKLNAILTAMGVERSSIYISNIVKFRPSMPRQTTNNRAPTDKEISASMPIISKEIELIQPAVIVALGATAARGLLNSGQAPLSSLRGKFHDFNGIPVRVTYHPSYLLRTEELSERRKVWEDMLTVMQQLGLPISDKQKNYFLPKKA